jgi:hypothetical protein
VLQILGLSVFLLGYGLLLLRGLRWKAATPQS